MRGRSKALQVAAVIGLALGLCSRPAQAEGPQVDEAERAYRDATEAERQLDFPRALEGYRRALSLRPAASFSSRARIRAEDLAAHAEGGFAPLARLESVRRQPSRSSDPAELASLESEAAAFPPGQVRAEARLLVAEAFGRRLRIPARAVAPALALLEDEAADRALRSQAVPLLVDAYEALGEHGKARAAAARYGALAPAAGARLGVIDRRTRLERVAVAALVVLLLCDAAAAAVAARAGRLAAIAARVVRAPTSLVVALVLAAGGATVATAYDATITTRPFWLLGAGVLLCDRSAALWRAAAGDGRLARLASVGLGLLGLASAALLALLWSDPSFIKSFGL
jgi:hypothetical protein